MSAKDRLRDWSDHEAHHIKRSLSSFEKSTIRRECLPGQALIMPAVPGTEVEELLAIGFSPRNLHCVEEMEPLADALYEHYWEQVSVHLLEVGTFLSRATTYFSYIHADYCGFLGREQIAGIETAITRLDRYARLRVSLMLSRRPEEQLKEERIIAERVLSGLAQAAAEQDDAGPERWSSLLSGIPFEDSTVTVAAIMIINIIFGMQAYEYSDACAGATPILPIAGMRPRIVDMQRYHYNETSNSNVMATIWIDIAPGMAGGQKVAVEELFTLMRGLNRPAMRFANPGIFA